jgi:hypothetical protein
MTAARLGFGVVFEYGNGASPEVFAELGELLEASPPSLSRATVDGTHHGSEDRYQEFISGLRDAGEVSMRIHYSDDAYTTLLAHFNDNASRNYRITGPSAAGVEGAGDEWAFTGFLTEIPVEAPLDDRMTIQATFKVSGKPTYTAEA